SAALRSRKLRTAVLLPEAGGPSTNRLKSNALMLVPNSIALRARSWPMRLVAGVRSLVEAKPRLAGLTRRRSVSASSGAGADTATAGAARGAGALVAAGPAAGLSGLCLAAGVDRLKNMGRSKSLSGQTRAFSGGLERDGRQR